MTTEGARAVIYAYLDRNRYESHWTDSGALTAATAAEIRTYIAEKCALGEESLWRSPLVALLATSARRIKAEAEAKAARQEWENAIRFALDRGVPRARIARVAQATIHYVYYIGRAR
jgi:hypothetical protein